ncbi:MAG: sigma-70 family RNA polymerase sigma factor [Bacteroidetes bacterium]|nr:sigma-70 family RNA polymerase sigma factor [Bacteroidota bacterium]
MNETEKIIERLYKEKYGQLVALLMQKFNTLQIETVEDVVQEAFVEAAARWPEQGTPQNPGGWLFHACRNKTINLLKKSVRLFNLSLVTTTVESEEISSYDFNDAQVHMLIACCHPHLPPKTQVVLALKYVANLKIESIALQLATHADSIEKTLYRARQKIKNESLALSAVRDGFSKERMAVLHKVIYLIFHEGYKQPAVNRDQGETMCEEALLMNKSLLDSRYANSETKALHALMLFNLARFDTRFDANGKPIELEYQNRSVWNRKLISLGHHLLIASEDTEFSPYHLEASIAFVHCSALHFEDTDWPAICKYYEVLLKIYPSPFAEINYAVALQYNHQVDKAYSILMNLYQNPYFHQLPILQSSLKKCVEKRRS